MPATVVDMAMKKYVHFPKINICKQYTSSSYKSVNEEGGRTITSLDHFIFD